MTMVRPPEELERIRLLPGAHGGQGDTPEAGCMIEWASYLAGEPWSDHPECVSPVIAAFCRSWNDSIGDNETRDRLLKPFLTKVIGTRTTAKDERIRSWLATDWAVRVQTVAWLRLAKLTDDADALAGCSEITDAKSAKAAQKVLDAAREHARAARDAAWDAAWAAAWAAARAAAWDAAGDAAWAAAWDAAGDAARDAAWAAAGDAARDAAWAAARAAARDAARAAARDAARDAARAALAPTVTELQTSAADLLDRMCAVGRTRELVNG